MKRVQAAVAVVCIFAASCNSDPAHTDPASNTATAEKSQSGDANLTLVPPGYERAAAGPSFFFHVVNDVYAAVDSIDEEVVFLDSKGKSLGAVALPAGFEVRDVDLGRIILLLGDTGSVEIPRNAALPRILRAGALGEPSTRVTRRGETLQIAYPGPNGPADITIPVSSGQRVLAAKFLGLDQKGNVYAYWQQGEGDKVTAWAGRFSPSGGASEATPIGLDQFAAVPALPIALTPAGRLILMQPTATTIELIGIEIGGDRAEEPIGEAPTSVLDVGDISEADDTRFDDSNEERVEAPAHDAAFGAATVQRARAYLNATWTLKPANFARNGIANSCVLNSRQFWKRPHTLTQERIDQTITSLPYKWGGSDTVQGFQQKIGGNPGSLAGDVCTCREARYGSCLVPQSAGVDCSGFVSRSWGLTAHVNTSALMGKARQLPSFNDLRAGDILNRPGNHVRLVVGVEPGPQLRIRTIKSAVSCGGVCEKVYTPAELNHYRPMRKI